MPDLERKFYTDADLDAAVRKITPQFYPQWLNFSRPIEKADFARYVLLYGEGGIYADLDVELLRPMYDLCECGSALLPMELLWELPPRVSYLRKRKRHTRLFMGQSVMISPKGWEVWLDLMQYLVDNYVQDGYETFNTGPDGVTAFFNRKPGSCQLYKTKPILGLLNGPFSIHHATGSWRTKDSISRKAKMEAKHADQFQNSSLKEPSCFF
jgi:hypothetical protein